MDIVFDILFVFAGTFIHMSILHLFVYYETQHHPMIEKSKNPYRASKLWGIVQFIIGSIILYLGNFQFGKNIGTLMVILGFLLWGLFLGFFAGKKFKKVK
jgi:hypothetical protein